MVHADASNFVEGITKEDAYRQVLVEAEALFEGQRNWVCNLANTASLLWHAYRALPAPSCHVNWVGFYVCDRPRPPAGSRAPELILGPFHGKVACQTIALGRGVCGAAAATGRTQLVRDVADFPGHIACDGNTRSEIVVPVVLPTGQVVAVIDVDCAEVGGFDRLDADWLGRLAELLGGSCDWP